MANIHRMEIVIDRDADLEPQIAVYRTAGVPWKFLEELSGVRKNRLEEKLARWRERMAARAISPGLTL